MIGDEESVEFDLLPDMTGEEGDGGADPNPNPNHDVSRVVAIGGEGGVGEDATNDAAVCDGIPPAFIF